MITSKLLLLFPLFMYAFAKPITRGLRVHESLTELPSGFVLKGPASPETILNLRLALMQSNVSGLIDTLLDVSTPTSSHYGHHLTKEEVCRSFFILCHESIDS